MTTNAPLKILFIASEAVPFVKTGGLADVVGALSTKLFSMGHDVRLVIPCYGDLQNSHHRFLPLMPEMKVEFEHDTIVGSVLRCSYPGTDMPVYFIEEPFLFGRDGIYGSAKGDFLDNHKRFAYFDFAALWLLKGLDWQPDILHLHDWQTGLVPVILRQHPVVSNDPFYAGVKTVFNIHNIAYQGNFDSSVVEAVRLPWSTFNQEGMEFYNLASYLKSGLVYSDRLVAVSPTYAKEIQTEELGAGMHGTLQLHEGKLRGILNGIDADVWDPAKDSYLDANYSAAKPANKAKCKAAVQEELGLPVRADVPLVAMVSRLVGGKGFGLIAEVLGVLLDDDAQFAVLGTGEPRFEEAFKGAAHAHPDRIAARIEYNERMSHRLIAGADIFLMPSLYEPCGLTQLYSMRYGTIPVARRTGGLNDTIADATPRAIVEGAATGFLFDDYTSLAMLARLQDALALYRKEKGDWARLMKAAMAKDFSWEKSAAEYERLYREVLAPA